jgi:hypothetical protein
MIEATLICHTLAGEEVFMRSAVGDHGKRSIPTSDIVEKPVPRF